MALWEVRSLILSTANSWKFSKSSFSKSKLPICENFRRAVSTPNLRKFSKSLFNSQFLKIFEELIQLPIPEKIEDKFACKIFEELIQLPICENQKTNSPANWTLNSWKNQKTNSPANWTLNSWKNQKTNSPANWTLNSWKNQKTNSSCPCWIPLAEIILSQLISLT